MKQIVYRPLAIFELVKLKEIDRTEEIATAYIFEGGKLKLQAEPCLAGPFTAEELVQMIEQQSKLLANGGIVIGAFDTETLIGITSVEQQKRGKDANYCKMDILYISLAYRGMGIAYQLLQAAKKAAQEFGARLLYISATPTQGTVDFYLKAGARLVTEIDPKLFELEPLDIHLELNT